MSNQIKREATAVKHLKGYQSNGCLMFHQDIVKPEVKQRILFLAWILPFFVSVFIV